MSKQEKTDMSLSDAEDSGISSWDSNTDVDSDIDLKTATLKDEIVVLKAVISKKDEQISTMQECMSRYEQQICNKNHLVQVLKKEIVKYESAHDTLMKLNKILKDNTGILEKSVLKRTKMLSKVKEDFDKLYQLKQNAEKTLREYNNTSKSEFPKRRSEVKTQPQIDTAALQRIAEGVNAILKHHANDKSNHQEDTEKFNSGSFFTFYGTPETIAISDWFQRIEKEFKNDWPDHKKIQFTLKRLDENNSAFNNLRQLNSSSYTNLKNHLLIVFGRIHKPYTIAR